MMSTIRLTYLIDDGDDKRKEPSPVECRVPNLYPQIAVRDKSLHLPIRDIECSCASCQVPRYNISSTSRCR